MTVFTQLTDTTSYWTIGVTLFVMGLGMGMTMMPVMSIALKTLKPEQVARAPTSLNIIQQVAASIGTALLSVILFNETKDRLEPVVARLMAQAPPGTQPPNVTSLKDLPEPVRQLIAPPMADAYSSTFVWAVVFLALAFIPALFLPRGKATVAPIEPATGADNEPPAVLDDAADLDELEKDRPEPVSEGERH
jgi:hypothetical protein